MGFDIDVHGLKEAQDQISKMIRSMTLEGAKQHCSDIKEEARKCGITDNDFRLEAVPAEDGYALEFSLKDMSKLPCLKDAVAKVAPTIPEGIRTIFESIVSTIEKGGKN
jgi:hypothetical protein